MIHIAIVDDHALVRTGLRLILEKQTGMQIVGEASDGESGYALIRQLKPDVALLDVHMPGVSGLEVTERVRKARLPTKIIILTMMDEAPYPRRLLEAGASGYLTKAGPADELVSAIRQVADGRRYLAADVAQQLALEKTQGDGNGSPFAALSARELEVAMMLAGGHEMPDIAGRLNLSVKTVATYKYRLYEKLEVNNEVTLTHLAMLHGVLDAARGTLRRHGPSE
jgi:two-component system, NarL family, invasion response regulator UvrY